MSKKKLHSDVVAGKNMRTLDAWGKRTRRAAEGASQIDGELLTLVDAYQAVCRDALGLRAYIWKQTTPDTPPSKGEDFLGRDAADQKAMLAQLKALDALSHALAVRLAIRGIAVPEEAK